MSSLDYISRLYVVEIILIPSFIQAIALLLTSGKYMDYGSMSFCVFISDSVRLFIVIVDRNIHTFSNSTKTKGDLYTTTNGQVLVFLTTVERQYRL